MGQRVVIGLSGGVDSSVAAWLLKEQGYDVVALFMINWHDTEGTLSGDCPWYDDRMFAELVAKRLDIPFHVVDLSEEYRRRVVDYMFGEYARGRTPNPDVLCNREIKFDLFMDEAFRLGADLVATGHYCRKESAAVEGRTVCRLLAGSDPGKDQSYFLCQLSQKQLSRAIFPIGDMLKSQVRLIAAEQQLATAKRKDSQGICFVGKVDLPLFLQQKLEVIPGEIIEIAARWPGYARREGLPPDEELRSWVEPCRYTPADGEVVGHHNGAHFRTIGQRKGLGVGGRREPLFVIATDTETNTVYVGQGDNHPGLMRKGLMIKREEIHWVRPDKAMTPDEERRYLVRIRYRQPLQQARLTMREEGLYVIFDREQRGITAGQFAAWYDGEELLGSGVIDR
ncbi:tRNA-specific 2-thiouridylase MnmA [Bacteroidia bacterium]|nr:tRNA-specific 2-thiouridylase MnmA [Bacteroidia bacterium]